MAHPRVWIHRARTMAVALLGLSLLVFLAAGSPSPAWAQKAPGRKVVHRVAPEYPQSLKDAHIGGTVRLYVTVLANGDVAKAEPLGGNPILVEAAMKAVLQWKFASAASRSNEPVQLEFKPY